ncbi:MAG TPA: sulfatase-like hydrolase/transferase [Fimbriiglobus sp.]|nr:sulfatase-like hydrolase/transferase [Fimbriiglobus sp.]
MRPLRLTAGLVLALAAGPARAADRPNVVFLLADDMRADAVAALGNPTVKTPNLDLLVRSGFVFRNTYCMGSMVGAVCNPSRHMLLSGKSLFRYDPKKADGTFADVMGKDGYETWHLGKRGNTAREYHKAFHHSAYLNEKRERTSGHHGRTAADRAVAFLKSGWDRKKPVFLFLAFEGPHDPRVAANEWMKLYDQESIPLPRNFKPFHPFDNGDLLTRDEALAPWPRTPAVVRKHLHDYYACISSIDHNAGRVVAALKDLGELDNTIIVFAADHGLAIGSHGLFGKQNLYEHSMKAPLVFAGPGIKPGSSDALVYLFDIFPTVADLCGATVPDGLDGRSLAPMMRGEKNGVRDTVFLAYKDVQRAVRRGDWKLIRYPKVDVTQLFDLKADPDELKSLAADPAQANRVREMMSLLGKEQKRYADKAPLTVANPRPAAVDESFFRTATRPNK